MSKSTVKKYVDGLRKKGMITTDYTTVKTKDGRIHNGSLLYTLLPIEPIEEAYFQKMLQMQRAKLEAQMRIDKYEKTRKDQK
jgi:predicted transcriptional regulator